MTLTSTSEEYKIMKVQHYCICLFFHFYEVLLTKQTYAVVSGIGMATTSIIYRLCPSKQNLINIKRIRLRPTLHIMHTITILNNVKNSTQSLEVHSVVWQA